MSAGPGELSEVPELRGLALSRAEVDRATARRGDTEWLEAAWTDPGTRVVVIEDGRALVRTGPGAEELVFVPPERAPDGVRFLLGIASDGTVYFGVGGPLPKPEADDVRPGGAESTARVGSAAARPGGAESTARVGSAAARPVSAESTARVGSAAARPVSLREAGPHLSDRDVGLMTHAVGLANWHAVHTHCPRCGAITVPEQAGHSRRCPVDGSEHFPRLDPAVIMLVTDPDDRCLLARNAQWPERRVSILAGFVEPGESAEQAVAREVLEETGISVTAVRYVGSQPWPMPHSLMLGFRARATGSLEIVVDFEEIAEARWFSRDELRASVASGEIKLPPPVSIAHRIIESWYGSDLVGAW